jgi:hypothetical protein
MLILWAGILSAAESRKMPVAAKWGRFEVSFRSSVTYSNPPQQATMAVAFTSPEGDTIQALGFWDGGRTWRVRFCPDQLGRWTYRSFCSDTSNNGLHSQVGEFLCISAGSLSRFQVHGPIRVARDHRHLEHVDGTPFFWLADSPWDGPRLSTSTDWDFYTSVRAGQGFSVAQWSAASGPDAKRELAFSGPPDCIAINPAFFQRLDAKLESASLNGVLSAIVPFFERERADGSGAALTDDQAALLLRYIVARWGASSVVWLLAFDGHQPNHATRWQRVGRMVFAQEELRHAPVMVYPGSDAAALDLFRDQKWVDVFGMKPVMDASEEALQNMFKGPFAQEWLKQPARPIIPFTLCENGFDPKSLKRISADSVRKAAYCGLLMTTPAGISYEGFSVENWDGTVDGTAQTGAIDLPAWKKALFMPGAKQMASLAKFVGSFEFWRLRPGPDVLASQRRETAANLRVASVGTEARDLSLFYSPVDRTIELLSDRLPAQPSLSWLNPRLGQVSPAIAVLVGQVCQLPTPELGDWLLISQMTAK